MSAEGLSRCLMTSAPVGCHTLPVEHLDYKYIQHCSDVKYLEKILRVLRLGIEGVYPHLTEFCEKRMELLDPKHRALRKESSPATPYSFSAEEWNLITEDLQEWQREISTNDQQLTLSPKFYIDALPPVLNRPLQKTLNPPARTNTTTKPPMVPRTYSDWDRFDVDAECVKIDECVKHDIPTVINNTLPNITLNINTSDLMKEERLVLSTREREKGNEAYRAGDWDEALLYYSRSVCILPTTAAYNNQAQVEITLQRWNDALINCNNVLKLHPTNYKALLRRATVHIHLENLHEAHNDITTVLQSEPQNPTAQKLLQEINKKINVEVQLSNQPNRGKKLLIQESEDDEESEENEEQREKLRAQNNNAQAPPTTKTPSTIEIQASLDTMPTLYESETPPTTETLANIVTPPSSTETPSSNSSTPTRRSVKIIEVEDDDDDDEEDYNNL